MRLIINIDDGTEDLVEVPARAVLRPGRTDFEVEQARLEGKEQAKADAPSELIELREKVLPEMEREADALRARVKELEAKLGDSAAVAEAAAVEQAFLELKR